MGGKTLLKLLNILGANCIRQTEIQTDGPLIPETSYFEVKTTIRKVKRHKSPCFLQTLAGLFQAGLETFPMRSLN
jgi:hypothetical protein